MVIYAEPLVFFLEFGTRLCPSRCPPNQPQVIVTLIDSGLEALVSFHSRQHQMCLQFEVGANKDNLSALAGTGLWRAQWVSSGLCCVHFLPLLSL